MTTSPRVLDPRAVELLRTARDWRLVGLLFERPHGIWLSEITDLALGCDDADLARAAASARDADEGDYLALLGPAGTVSPREAGYRKTTDPARLLAEIQAYYEAFAFHPEAEDPPDHVAVEAGFLGWLCLKQAYALVDGGSEALSVTADAAQSFVAEHLACVAHGIEHRLASHEESYLLHAARALIARVGPLPKVLEGDWVPSGLEHSHCSVTCGLNGGADKQAVGEGDEIPPEFRFGLPASDC
ncbi:MAG: molecular chaperone TorD family protein [Planctomycetes bacterium]|nr:molecular chaperone TorD family protein [Planctomycetota bacterium]